MLDYADARPGCAAGPGDSVRLDRDAYDRDGFLAPLPVLSAEEAAVCRRQLVNVLGATGGAARAVRNKPHLRFAWAADLVRRPALVEAVAALLGPDLLVLRSTLFIKAAHDASVQAWHQDAYEWGLDGDAVVSAWVALTDSTTANGAVRVLPGSHRGPRLAGTLRLDAQGRLLRGQSGAALDDASAIALELRAGECSLHHGALVHGSPGNPSGAPRIGLAIRYIAAATRQRGPRQGATLVRGAAVPGRFLLEPPLRADGDPAAAAAHRRDRRRYALQILWQTARAPSWRDLRTLARAAWPRRR